MGKCIGVGVVKIVVDMVNEGLIDKLMVVNRVEF